MKASSGLVIVIPIVIAGTIIAGVFLYNAQRPLDEPVVVSAKTAVPALSGSAGKPQKGFAVDELSVNSVLDLTQELNAVSDDAASDDFEALQADATAL